MQEKKLSQNDFIVSKTDTKGKIIYCNEIFMEMAGYLEKELLFKNHNIIRHEGMPKAAFELAWNKIQNGEEFFGFVKNKSKNGNYYWVFATISADYDTNNKIIGYTSIRRKPKESAIEIIKPIYEKLLSIEKSSGLKSSTEFLVNYLKENNTSYDDLILTLQGA